ncbi:MAG: glycosyltransferase family 2 protein, partial [Bacteroidota bacterium]|nr:glycosyltransferase family 2 protein [Bacteroidota bacterium]
DYAAAIQLFITGKPRNAMSVIKARRAYKQLQPAFEAKRKQNISCATTDCKSDILQQSIVLDYYLKGKKTFTALTGK